MKKNVYLLCCFMLSFSALAQESTDYYAKKNREKKYNVGISLSVGVNVTQYSSDRFFDSLFNKTFSPANGSASASTQPYTDMKLVIGNPKPNYISKNNPLMSSIYGIGLEFTSLKDKKIKLNHVIQLNYTQLSGAYSYSTTYKERWMDGGNGWQSTIKDTTQATYNQTAVSIGYKFQPVYKNFFLSFGIKCFYNFLKLTEQKIEHVDGIYTPEFNPPYSYSKQHSSAVDTSTHFINFPMELGIGYNFQIKRFIIKPAFYYSPCFIKGYNFYSLSLGIVYNLRKEKKH